MKTLTVNVLVEELSSRKEELQALLERGHVGLFPAAHAEQFASEADARFEQWKRDIQAIDRVLERIAD
jgi:hypothetical protein